MWLLKLKTFFDVSTKEKVSHLVRLEKKRLQFLQVRCNMPSRNYVNSNLNSLFLVLGLLFFVHCLYKVCKTFPLRFFFVHKIIDFT